jgi:UDP-N-acetylmuramoylalanine--D-glutamate ligase
MIPITTFKGRTVAVFGLGLSGRAAAKALMAGGAHVAAWDDGEESRKRAADEGIPVFDLHNAAWHELSALVLAPGVPLTHPEPHWTVKRAETAGVEVIGDTELFFREREALGSKARVVGITGTNGKSTTTALTAHILREAGYHVAMGGNIGEAILGLAPLTDDMVYVIEFSSYQIDLTPGIAPNAAVLLNLSPDHLDRHGNMDRYARVKAGIFANQESADTAIVGVEDKFCSKIADRLRGMGSIQRISTIAKVDQGVWVADGVLHEMAGGKEVATASIADIATLRGTHNWQNAAAAWALVRSLGLPHDVITSGLASFPGLAHRMEIIGSLKGPSGEILFVNDSKATNADAAAKALAAYDDIYWIAGGVAKAGGLAGLDKYYPKIAKAYLIGVAANDFAKQLGSAVPHVISGMLEIAIAQATADAKTGGRANPVVLLSPACASFDQYRNFEIRGDAFRGVVKGLDGVAVRGEGEG